MSIAKTNAFLQTSVAYQLQDKAGAYTSERLSLSFDMDSDDAEGTIYPYGGSVTRGQHGGVKLPAASSAVAELAGVVKYANTGIIDDAGVKKGFYRNLPVLQQGLIYAKSTGAIAVGATLYLYVDPSDTTNFNKVRSGTASGAIDISSIAKVKAAAANNICLIDVNII